MQLRLAHVGQKAGVRGAAGDVVQARFGEAEFAVDGEAHVGGVCIFLPVVFPPADRAEGHGIGGFEGAVATAGAAIRVLHMRIDG